ncbi:MAG TPA: hypothetical protein VFJ06_03425 [Halococcus sp.]|nr:hypothetical protein [Halococcus sp.]
MESDGNEDDRTARAEREHVQSVPDGCGCAEIWEYLSEQRATED